jgi:hypothetical protein
MSTVSLPSGLGLKFISPVGYCGRIANIFKKPKYTHAIPVKAGSDVVTDQYITSTGISGSLGILMTDGNKAYFRSHFVTSGANNKLEAFLENGLRQLDSRKPIQGLVIGGTDHSDEAQTALDKVKAFLLHNHIPVTILAPQKQNVNGCPKASSLVIKTGRNKILIANQDADLFFRENASLKPLMRDEQDLSDFYREACIAPTHALKFVEKDSPFGKRPKTSETD